MRRIGSVVASLAAIACSALAPVAAGAEPPPPKDWEVELLGYGWLPSLDAEVETPRRGTQNFEVSVSDVLENLQLAAMGRLNVRWRRWLLVADALYTKLEEDQDVTLGRLGRLQVDADFEQEMALAQALVGYRVYARPGGLFGTAQPGDERLFGFDVLGGVNYTWLSIDVELDRKAVGNLIPEREREFGSSNDWFAPAGGIRLHNDFTSRVRLETLATVGGFGVGEAPDLSWQLTTLLSYRFTDHWLVSAGHRLYAADNDDNEIRMHGAIIGVGYRF
jgi:hypothetical protein